MSKDETRDRLSGDHSRRHPRKRGEGRMKLWHLATFVAGLFFLVMWLLYAIVSGIDFSMVAHDLGKFFGEIAASYDAAKEAN